MFYKAEFPRKDFLFTSEVKCHYVLMCWLSFKVPWFNWYLDWCGDFGLQSCKSKIHQVIYFANTDKVSHRGTLILKKGVYITIFTAIPNNFCFIWFLLCLLWQSYINVRNFYFLCFLPMQRQVYLIIRIVYVS